jgi:predicted TIM-barrel fold metal-dependent hydrolase
MTGGDLMAMPAVPGTGGETAVGAAVQALVRTADAVLGSDRVMFATDYPYESMREAAEWFDTTPLQEEDRHKIAHENAEKLFGLTA